MQPSVAVLLEVENLLPWSLLLFFLDWRKLPGKTLKLQRYPSDHDNNFSQPLSCARKIKEHYIRT